MPKEGREAHGHLVGPVQILENHDQGLLGCEYANELEDTLEQQARIRPTTCRPVRCLHFGEKSCQLRPVSRPELLKKLTVLGEAGSTEGVRPGSKWKGPLRFVTAADEDRHAAARGLVRELRNELGLANACLAKHHDDSTAVRHRVS